MRASALRAVALGLASALFFTMTYVLNRGIVEGGGHWAWAVSLRYLITLPLLAAVLPFQGGPGALPRELAQHRRAWLLWSGVGFFVFGSGLTWAAASGPAWLVAGSFQSTVLAGPLLAPLIYRDARGRLAWAPLAVGALIFAGVLAMQLGHARGALDRAGWLALGAVVVAAFAYPLGNRMILLHLERSGNALNATQRVFGMTLASQPWWLALAAWAWLTAGPPSPAEILLAGGVALSSGVIATILFFAATARVRHDPTALAAVEAMQAAELLFSCALGALCLGEPWPRGVAALGALAVIAGIALFSWLSARGAAEDARVAQALRTDRGA